MSEVSLLDRVIDYLNIVVNINYLSINELLVARKVITAAENKEILDSPNSEDAMTNLVYKLTKRPERCCGFVTVLRESNRRQNHWIAEQIDPEMKYSNQYGGFKTKLAKAVGSIFSTSNGTASSTKDINSLADFPEESIEARYGSLDSFSTSLIQKPGSDTNSEGSKSVDVNDPPPLPPKPRYRRFSNILDGSQTISFGFRSARARKSLSTGMEQYAHRGSWTQTLLRRPKSVDSTKMEALAPQILPLESFTTYRDQDDVIVLPSDPKSVATITNDPEPSQFKQPFRRSKRFTRLTSYMKKGPKNTEPDLPETPSTSELESESQNLHIEMDNGAIKRLHVISASHSEPKKSKMESLTTLLRRVSIRKKKLDRNKLLLRVEQQKVSP